MKSIERKGKKESNRTWGRWDEIACHFIFYNELGKTETNEHFWFHAKQYMDVVFISM